MPSSPATTAGLPLAKPVVDPIPDGTLRTLERKARGCRNCPLWRPATQTVFGQGPADAMAMLVGEQPGNQEDLTGAPFVGPAGQLLDRALGDAGLDRGSLYLTNTVKHFKFEQRGKARLHKRANAAEQEACRMWLAAELLRVQPRIVVALGAMAAHTIFGNGFRVTRERGQWRELAGDARGIASWHPSAVLRMPGDRREQGYRELVEDLGKVAGAIRSSG
jgi:uracil-DNA glycosylase family protein